jgi:hypothetical protein
LTPGPSFYHNLCCRFQMAHASPFSTSTLWSLSNDINNASMRGVLTPTIELWSFESPPSPHFGSVSLVLTLSQSRVAT